jgi:hypothetical protein
MVAVIFDLFTKATRVIFESFKLRVYIGIYIVFIKLGSTDIDYLKKYYSIAPAYNIFFSVTILLSATNKKQQEWSWRALTPAPVVGVLEGSKQRQA